CGEASAKKFGNQSCFEARQKRRYGHDLLLFQRRVGCVVGKINIGTFWVMPYGKPNMKLLYNANIHTLDSSNPLASAILIAGGRIIAVGSKDQLEALAHGKVEKQDMKGKTILPGLTDAHIHMQYYSLGLSKVDCETKIKEECLRRVEER